MQLKHPIARERERLGWSQERLAEEIGVSSLTVSRWERRVSLPHLYYRKKLCELFHKNAGELEIFPEERNEYLDTSCADPSDQETTGAALYASQNNQAVPPTFIWNVPYRRNPFFIGREDILARLYEILHAEKAIALTQAQAISGLGGIGKTQTALEYAYRFRSHYNVVLWARAETRSTLVSDFATFAALLNLPERDEQDQSHVCDVVKAWLDEHTNWLLILDNVEDLSIVEDFTPSNHRGHVLLTTRVQSMGAFAQRIDLEMMTSDEGALLLLRRAQRIAYDDPLEAASLGDRLLARTIAETLDGLPLALDQAGAYIEEAECSLSDYLDRYRLHREALLGMRSIHDSIKTDHPLSVAATFALSFGQVEQANAAAADLLRLCAFLHPDAIPEEILTVSAPALGPGLQSMVADPFKFDITLAELRKYSLVRRNSDAKTLTTHRLVQAILKDRMPQELQYRWAECAVIAVNCAFPQSNDLTTWSRCQRCFPHAQVCAALIEEWNISSPEAGELLTKAGNYLQARGQFGQAESLLEKALEIRERVLGREHLDVAGNLNDLAVIYYEQGKNAQAEPLFKRSLQMRREMLGAEHPSLAECLHNLAVLYFNLGKYTEAESFYQQALAIKERSLEDSTMAHIVNGLARVYLVQGKYAEAEPLFQRALLIWQQTQQSDHPDVAFALDDLARLYRDTGKYAEAEPLFQQALLIREQSLGPEHPSVAVSLNGLARLYRQQGKYDIAESLFQRALEIREKALGPQHPYVATSLNNLAKLYYDQGQYSLAEALFMQALAIREAFLGPEHPELATSLHDLARLYFAQGAYGQAEPLYQRALTIREKTLGREHPRTTQIFDDLEKLYSIQKA